MIKRSLNQLNKQTKMFEFDLIDLFIYNLIDVFIRYEDMKYALKKLDDTKFKSHEVNNFSYRISTAMRTKRRSLTHFNLLLVNRRQTNDFKFVGCIGSWVDGAQYDPFVKILG